MSLHTSQEFAMRSLRTLLAVLTAAVPAAMFAADPSAAGPAAAKDAKSPIGRKIDGFRLPDHRGARHSLGDAKDQKLAVVAFLATECPLAQQYARRLGELAGEFGPQRVAFFGIVSNPQESLADIERYVTGHKLDFPVLKDLGAEVADQFGAQRTPEVFVLDTERTVRYWGRIDDQYGVGYKRAKPTRRDLAVALEELLAGKAVSRPMVESVGCHIGRAPKTSPQGDITYAKHVAPLLARRCASCHRLGDIAPFALTTYDETTPWAETIREVVESGRMPPWHASPAHGKFANDPRLSAAEKKLICDWVENGMPAGDLKQARPQETATPPAGPDWRIGKPDLVLQMPQPFKVPAAGTVGYQYYLIDPELKKDLWVKASEVRPTSRQVTHHAVVFVQPPGDLSVIAKDGFGFQMLAAYGPGVPPLRLKDGLAKLVPAGSKLVFQMHYTPCGVEQIDQTQVGLMFADPKEVKKEHRSGIVLNYKLKIPPGARDYQAEAFHQFGQDTWLYSLAPHMHLRGKSFLFEAIYPDGRREVLLEVPRWDFEWQHVYKLAEPKRMPEGARLHCTARFDNSEANFWNPDPKREVTFGLQTSQEMMVGFFESALVDQDLSLGGPQVRPLPAGPDGARQYEVTFQYRPPADAKAKTVYLAGAFNDWKPDGHQMDGPDRDGAFVTRLTLKKGSHEYKFVIDGKVWKHDPGNRHQAGFYNNSVVEVGTTP
jgi:peroxiredoxin